jgi:hypothetical protein
MNDSSIARPGPPLTGEVLQIEVEMIERVVLDRTLRLPHSPKLGQSLHRRAAAIYKQPLDCDVACCGAKSSGALADAALNA